MGVYEITTEGGTYQVETEDPPSVSNLTGAEPGSFTEAARTGIGGLSKIIPFGDEIVAGGSAGLDYLLGNADYGDAYNQRLNEVRNYKKAFNLAANEVGYGAETATDIINAFTMPVPNVFSTGKGVIQAGKNIAKASGLGGLYGAGLGFSEGEGEKDRLEKAATGGAVGLATGGILGTAAEGLMALGNKLSSAAEAIGSKIVGYNEKTPGKKIGFFNKEGQFTKDASQGVTSVSRKDVARNNLQPFLNSLKQTDTPEMASVKLSQFRQANGEAIGDTIDTLAEAEQKILSTKTIPQRIISTGDDRPDLLARQFVYEPNKAIDSIEQAAPDFTVAQAFIDDIAATSASKGATLQETLTSIKNAWEKSDKTLSSLKNIQEKFGLIKKAAFSGNKAAGLSEADFLNNQIYGALAESVSGRVEAVAKASGKSELFDIFKLANKNFSAAKQFEDTAFKASRNFGLKQGLRDVFSPYASGGLSTTIAGGLAGGAASMLSPLLAIPFGAERLGSVFAATKPITAMKAAQATSPYIKAFGDLVLQKSPVIATQGPQSLGPPVKKTLNKVLPETQEASASMILNRPTKKEAMPMPTEKTVELIKKMENVKLKAYRDTGGVWTVGYGHTGSDVNENTVITHDQAKEYLAKDLDTAESAVLNAVEVDLTPSQLTALTSLVYNVGEGAFKKSTLLKKLNAGDIKGAAAEFDRWVYDNGKRVMGLVNRRGIEKRLFLRA